MVEYEEIKKRFFYEGVELASFVGRYPAPSKYPSLSQFYGELTKSSFEWFCTELCETLKAEYEQERELKKILPQGKRFNRDVCHYEAIFNLTSEEKYLTVRCDVSMRKGKKKILARFSEVQNWDEEGKLMIRPKRQKNRRAK